MQTRAERQEAEAAPHGTHRFCFIALRKHLLPSSCPPLSSPTKFRCPEIPPSLSRHSLCLLPCCPRGVICAPLLLCAFRDPSRLAGGLPPAASGALRDSSHAGPLPQRAHPVLGGGGRAVRGVPVAARQQDQHERRQHVPQPEWPRVPPGARMGVGWGWVRGAGRAWWREGRPRLPTARRARATQAHHRSRARVPSPLSRDHHDLQEEEQRGDDEVRGAGWERGGGGGQEGKAAAREVASRLLAAGGTLQHQQRGRARGACSRPRLAPAWARLLSGLPISLSWGSQRRQERGERARPLGPPGSSDGPSALRLSRPCRRPLPLGGERIGSSRARSRAPDRCPRGRSGGGGRGRARCIAPRPSPP